MLVIFLISALISNSIFGVRGDIYGFSFGVACPESPVISDFDANKYVGKWYEIERIPMIFERGLECVTAEYNLLEDGSISVKNSGVKKNGKKSSVDGIASLPNPETQPNMFYVDFRNKGKHSERKNEANYHIWATDYENYSLVYSCNVYAGFIKFEAAWILAREKKLNEEIITELKEKLTEKGVHIEKLKPVSQHC
ncbi:unnamed protein product [Brachionus calyciflorus]|uniref:Apolipoprotein D n=1 Tax=Brachionus calyciflorus TaxID=104777 RepID=A0A813SAB9_9BILA|nr:unnamed protein product [Brachionus calyciflorus]